jgi:hypothetical protein
VGVVAFLIAEHLMKDDALIPLHLFKNSTFSMATVMGVLVGFGMFGALLTIPLYLQLVQGYTPTESGLQMIPLILGIMTASIISGQLIARTGKYRIFPITGTAILAAAFFYLTFVTPDRPAWWLWIGMFMIGLGLGQLMQTLTIASQNAVDARYIGVATSSSTFFRQIGGTLGTAILFSVLFSRLPDTLGNAFKNKHLLTNALNSALDPAVANAPHNRGIMATIWDKIVDPIKQQLPPGVDLSNGTVRHSVVEKIVSALNGKATTGGGSGNFGNSLNGDTSFLNSATRALKEPFLTGFTDAMITVFWVGLCVVAVAFVLSLFFKAPPLRATSALQDAANAAAATDAMVAPGDADIADHMDEAKADEPAVGSSEQRPVASSS